MTLNNTTIHNMRSAVDDELHAGRLGAALGSLDAMARAAQAPFSLISRISALADSYRMLSRYLIDGTPDSERNLIADDIAAEASLAVNMLERQLKADNATPSLYFSTMRFEATRPVDTISFLIDAYIKALGDNAPATTAESLATRLFNRLWVTFPLEAADYDTLHSVMADDPGRLPPYTVTFLIGALLLGSLQYFDPRRAILLADIYRLNSRSPIGLVALTALILALSNAPTHATGSRKLRRALEALEDVATLADDSRRAFMQLIRSRDTERITRKISDELIPGILRMKPDIDKTMKDLEGQDTSPFDDDGEINPAWEELFEQSGLGDKLRELNELQSEGADVMMSTMAQLKDFPFFNEPANWFLPFYREHSLAARPEVAQLTESIHDLPMMCNGDKYSLILLASKMGGMMSGMGSQLDAQRQQMAELAADDIYSEERERTNAVNSFVHDTYRFFKLFRRNNEFDDPFSHPLSPAANPILRKTIADDVEALTVAAEFYFRREHYGEALELLTRLDELAPASPGTLQKKGYALEQLGRPSEALEAYDTSDLLDPSDIWTLRRIATLLRDAGRPADALPYYERIQALRPDKYPDIMARAKTFESLSRYSDALRLYYQADYMRPDRTEVVGPMVRALIITGKHDKALAAARRLRQIAPDKLGAPEHILRGHAAIVNGQYHEAVAAYADAIATMDFNLHTFASAIATDRPLLLRSGVDTLTLNIISEAAAEQASTRGSQIKK